MKSLNAWNAELLGTFWLVLGGCGSAVLAAKGIGLLGVSLAFGLTVLTGAAALGPVSGGHFNPAVTLGLWAGGRFPQQNVIPYIIAQVVGATIAAGLIYLIASGKAGVDPSQIGLATNGYGEHSPQGYSAYAAFLTELILTAVFLYVIMGATAAGAPAAVAPVVIGLTLTLIHLISIPVTNTSVNPARSMGPALLEGGIALQQVWMFWLAPVMGGILGALTYNAVNRVDPDLVD
jgi:aquaporin Z